MSPIAEQFLALPVDQKRAVHFLLCEHALQRWRDFVRSRGQIRYVETVCCTNQVVDAALPEDAFRAAETGRDSAAVDERYLEPISALQDDDLELPDAVEYAYYAVYNLFRKYARQEPIDDWMIVNQALSSETDESRWRPLFNDALARAGRRSPAS